MTVLFGILFLSASLALALGWDLLTVAVYAFLLDGCYCDWGTYH